MNIHSIDLHGDDQTVNEFYAVSRINVEEEVMVSVGLQEITNVLEEEEKQLLCMLGMVLLNRKLL